MNNIYNFIAKYNSSYTIEIYKVNKKFNDNIYNININENKFNLILNELSKDNEITKYDISQYYYGDCYMEINHHDIQYKKCNIVDKLYSNNLLIVVKKIININSDRIPGLNNYDNILFMKNKKIKINDVNIILKENGNNSRNVCITGNCHNLKSLIETNKLQFLIN